MPRNPRKRTPASALDGLKREAKRWLKLLRENNSEAHARFRRALPSAPREHPTLRDVQHALAREHGFVGWIALAAATNHSSVDPRATAVAELVAAAARGDRTRVAALLDERPDIVNERGVVQGHSGLRSALHFAVGRSDEALVALLLDRGADPNVRDEGDNAIPLHFAAEKEHLAIIQLLIEHGSDPIGAGDGHELEVIGWATVFGKTRRDVADYLLANGARHNIASAVAMGDTVAIRTLAASAPELLDRPMDRANNFRRPLHLAIVKSQPQSLATLLELGADAEATEASELTPLDLASLSNQPESVQQLLDFGAVVHLPAAIALGRADDVERELAADPDALKPGGRWATLIVRAAERSSFKVMERLLRAGASPNAVDDTGTSVDSTANYTPLHAAAFAGNSAAISVLMRAGANVRARDSRYCGTPAGWADYARHSEARDFILQGDIDLFEAIDFGLTHRVAAILDADAAALHRPFGEYAECAARGNQAAVTPLMRAVERGREDIAEILRSRAANARRNDETDSRVTRFLMRACLDWRVGGGQRDAQMYDAARLLRGDPAIARDSIYTAVAAGDLDEVHRQLAERPERASQPGGPRGWPSLLYLCSARLPIPAAADNAVAIARALLDHGADPNAFYFGGNPSIHYTALTCVLGRGEEQARMHPRAEELAELLAERGAEPYDSQVLYNVFANHASRKNLGDDIVWLMDLIYRHSLRLGRAADWSDPDWKMLDMGGYGPGARFLLGAAVDANLPRLTEWMFAHGARRNVAPAAPSSDYDAFVDACFRLDRRDVERAFAAHPEYRDDHRALFLAVERNRADVVALLIDAGVSPNVSADDEGSRRALHVAAYAGATDAAQLLIDRGADVDVRESKYGGIPLGVASWAQQPQMIELFGRHSRDMWELVYTGRTERVREVLHTDPAVARATNEGQTPLMWLPSDDAAARAIAEMLLANGADPAARDAKGRTAADIARDRGMDDVADLLDAASARATAQAPADPS